MLGIENLVKPILEEMGVFNGKEVSVKEAFDKYVKAFPSGIGPLGVFMKIIERKLPVTVKNVRSDGKIVDYLFIHKPVNDLLYYDPRA